MQHRPLSVIDNIIVQFDTVVKTLSKGAAQAQRANPGHEFDETINDDRQRQHTAGLMRINHTGEVCAQALYQGQALTAKTDAVRTDMNHAAAEEIDHLVWCEQRLDDLNSQASVLNPIFYVASFGLGAIAGSISDRLSLGFVAATEDQVCAHLEDHLAQLPESDQRSRAILQQMLSDEQQHGAQALAAGGYVFPKPVKSAMTLLSKVMTSTTYRV